MAYSNLVDAVGGYARRLGTGGRTTLTGLPRTSGSKWRAIMDDFKNRARERSLREQGMRGGIQGSPSQFAQQVAPRAQRPAGDPAQTAITPRDQEGPSRWAQAWPQVQAMGIGMLHGAQTTPYNRAPNWATSLAGGFPAAAAAGANVREQVALSEQEGEQDTFRADMARLMESGELGEEELKRMIAMAIKAEDQQLATALMRMLESIQDAAVPTEIETITQEIIDESGATRTGLYNKATGELIRDLGISEIAEVDQPGTFTEETWNAEAGRMDVGLYNEQTGELIRMLGQAEAPEVEEVLGDWTTMTPTEGDGRASANQGSVNVGFTELEKHLGQAGFTVGLSGLLSGPFGRFLQDVEMQKLQAAGKIIAGGILRWESGGTINEQEIQSWVDAKLPQVGDEPETIALKMRALMAQIRDFNRAARVYNQQPIDKRWEIGYTAGADASSTDGVGGPPVASELNAAQRFKAAADSLLAIQSDSIGRQY